MIGLSASFQECRRRLRRERLAEQNTVRGTALEEAKLAWRIIAFIARNNKRSIFVKTFYKLSAVLVMLCALSLIIVTSALADTSGYAPTFFNSSYAKTHEINSLEANNTVTLKWVDSMGNTVRSETLAPGQSANPIGINASLYDTETMIATVVTGWYWDLDGEGDLYAEEPISSYTADDAEKVGGSEITVYPKSETRDLSEGMAYIAYYTDSDKTRR